MKRILPIFLALLTAFALAANAGAVNSAVPKSEEGDAFSFLYFGDVHVGGAPSLSETAAAWETLAKSAVSRNPGVAFALQGGDIVDNGVNQSQWDALLSATDKAFGSIPFFPVNGNHESNFLSGKPELYLKMFGLPQNGPEGFKGEFYSFDYGNVHVQMLNSWVFSGEQKLTESDYARLDKWVLDDLAASDSTWKIAVTHVPLYAVHSDATSTKMRTHWAKLFERYGLDLLLVGHQHVYSRLMPMTDGAVDFENGVTQIMGNASLKFYDSADETYAERTVYGIQTYQLLRVDGDNLTMQCFDGDGNELDYIALAPKQRDVASKSRLTYIETLWELAGSPSATGKPFTDADGSAVAWAYETGLVLGYGDGRFGANDAVTKAQIETIRERAEKAGIL